MSPQPTIVYVDGIYDLFHRGHVESLRKAKEIRNNVYLIVGLISTENATKYKRKPIFEDDDRYLLLKSCRYVDQVVYNAPLVITKQFMNQYNIDLVVHGYSDINDLVTQQPFIDEIIDKFEYLPYFPYNSTSKYLEKIRPLEQDTFEEMEKHVSHFHGGQDVHLLRDDLVVDMSVTTNGLGPNKRWVMESETLFNLMDHYPPSNDVELLDRYWEFMGEHHLVNDDSFPKRNNVIFGNGASEVIDLVLREIPKGNWKKNHVDFQYKEYENSCTISGRECVPVSDMNVALTVIINPNNPTGDYSNWKDMITFVDKYVPNNSHLVVDESMIFWDPEWRCNSFVHHPEYCQKLLNDRNISVVIVQSWTKIFSCTGLRFGSLFVHDDKLFHRLSIKQTPWSVNVVARDYVKFCWGDRQYLNETIEKTALWRDTMVCRLKSLYPDWDIYGKPFLSWIWINTKSIEVAERIVRISLENGFPIRHGKQGYGGPQYIRLGVRDPEKIEPWFCLIDNKPNEVVCKSMVPCDIVLRTEIVSIDKLSIHEEILDENMVRFEKFADRSDNFLLPSILVSPEYVIIDGHHRYQLFKSLGYHEIHVSVINYMDHRIVTHEHPDIASRINKVDVIKCAINSKPMKPKSTKHMINYNDKYVPISILGTNLSISR